jgi:hypothetical protein
LQVNGISRRVGEYAKIAEISTSRIRCDEKHEVLPEAIRGANGVGDDPDMARVAKDGRNFAMAPWRKRAIDHRRNLLIQRHRFEAQAS